MPATTRIAFLATAILASLTILVSAARAADPATGPSTRAAGAWRSFDGAPGERYATEAVWDAHKNRLLLMAGERNIYKGDKFGGFVLLDDMWAFDPAKSQWTQLKPAGPTPPRRAYHAMCYDSKRHGVWLHGGFDGKMLGDFWFFDSEKDGWEKIAPAGDQMPSPRDGASLVYDARDDSLLLFGGLTDFAKMTSADELWSFDIANKTWSKKATGPGARFCTAAAFDSDDRVLYVVGGYGDGGKPVESALWAYDLAKDAWAQADDGPGKTFAARMAYLPQSRALVLYSGNAKGQQTFDLKARTWTAEERGNYPPNRCYAAMACDLANQRLFVYGGTRGNFIDKCMPAELWIRSFEK